MTRQWEGLVFISHPMSAVKESFCRFGKYAAATAGWEAVYYRWLCRVVQLYHCILSLKLRGRICIADSRIGKLVGEVRSKAFSSLQKQLQHSCCQVNITDSLEALAFGTRKFGDFSMSTYCWPGGPERFQWKDPACRQELHAQASLLFYGTTVFTRHTVTWKAELHLEKRASWQASTGGHAVVMQLRSSDDYSGLHERTTRLSMQETSLGF